MSQLNTILIVGAVGAIGYFVYKNYNQTSVVANTVLPTGGTQLPASWANVTAAAVDAANAAQIKVNQDYAAAVKANDQAKIAQALKDAANAQVIIGNARDPRTPINCIQPNFIKDGVCVDPFTLKPPTLQGLEGLGAWIAEYV